MKIQAVIGANYGDEGKGLVSGCLAREANKRGDRILTVFFNGTMQRAHTFEGEIHRAMAAGTKYGSDTFYHKKFVVDPISLWILQAEPIIDPRCRIILPCDVMINRKKETERGEKRHGSCGFGLFEAVKRCSEDRENAIFAKDIQDATGLWEKLNKIQKKYPVEHDQLYNADNFMRACDYIRANCRMETLREIVGEYDTVIFEGGQGLLLDQNNRDGFPNLTPSNTGCRNFSEDIIEMNNAVELFYVSRSYETRHGAGKMTRECLKEEINGDIYDSTNTENDWQGGLRFGKLDTDALVERIHTDSLWIPLNLRKVNLVFTQMNYTNGMLETINGHMDPKECSVSKHVWISDQKDHMELLQ